MKGVARGRKNKQTNKKDYINVTCVGDNDL